MERIHRFGKIRLMVELNVLCLTLFAFSIALAAEAWNCPECGRIGNTGNYCGGCGRVSPYIEGQNGDSSKDADSAAEFRKAGSIVTFGRYEQDNKTENGPEEIEWIVLDYDEKEHKSLLLSRYGLDAESCSDSLWNSSWNECKLRLWLNGLFLNEAFTTAEQTGILLTNVDNNASQGYDDWNTNGGKDTLDKVFLLSYIEANKYLGVTYENTSNTESRVAPTAYAINRGAWISGNHKTADHMDAGWWWLRSPGTIERNAACVSTDGSLSISSVNEDDGCVRPALWINLESEFF